MPKYYSSSKGVYYELDELKKIFVEEARNGWMDLRNTCSELHNPGFWAFVQTAMLHLINDMSNVHTKEDLNSLMLAWRDISFDDWISSL